MPNVLARKHGEKQTASSTALTSHHPTHAQPKEQRTIGKDSVGAPASPSGEATAPSDARCAPCCCSRGCSWSGPWLCTLNSGGKQCWMPVVGLGSTCKTGWGALACRWALDKWHVPESNPCSFNGPTLTGSTGRNNGESCESSPDASRPSAGSWWPPLAELILS
jgi:hypothetical protein